MSLENVLKAILASREVPSNFSLHYTDHHTLWGGTTLTVGLGRGEKKVHDRYDANPQIFRAEIESKELLDLAALLVELELWKEIVPPGPLIPDEVLARLTIRAGDYSFLHWERCRELDANLRLIRVREKMNSLFEAAEPDYDGNKRPDDLAERNERLAVELRRTMQFVAPGRERLEDEKESDASLTREYHRRRDDLPKQREHVRYCGETVFKGLTCRSEDLLLVRWLADEETLVSQSAIKIFLCRACSGFYKYEHSACYRTRNIDCEEGWQDDLDRYFKVEEDYVNRLPLPYEEAVIYGYNGEPVAYARERCANPPDFSGLACIILDVVKIGGALFDGIIKKCRKCGEFYKQVWFRDAFPSAYHHYKPDEVFAGTTAFPSSEAVRYGYRPR